jgi:hypothetical protein
MIGNWVRAIFFFRETGERIAFLKTRLQNLEYEKEKLMSRMDELTAIVVEVGAAVDSVISHVHVLTDRVATAGVEDPAVGAAVDTLRATRDRLNAVLPAPVDPARLADGRLGRHYPAVPIGLGMDGFCKPACVNCFAFAGDPEDDTSGLCHFDPRQIIVRDDHWCGRWRNIHLEKFALWDVPEDVHNAKIDP